MYHESSCFWANEQKKKKTPHAGGASACGAALTTASRKRRSVNQEVIKGQRAAGTHGSADITVDYSLTPPNNGTARFTRPDSPFHISPQRHRSPRFAFRKQNRPAGDAEAKPNTIRTVFDSALLLLLPSGRGRRPSCQSCVNVSWAAAKLGPYSNPETADK